VRVGQGDLALCLLHHRGEGGQVGIADAERDHVDARLPLLGDIPLELGEQVGRKL
jgi:hypothetical protein